MVDIDDLRDEKDSESSESKSKQEKPQETSESVDDDLGSDAGTFSVDQDDMVDPSDKVVSETSKNWANDKGEMNYGKQGSETFEQYANRQVKEVEELHENIREMANKHMDNFDEFTLYFHAMFLNFAQNRVGIAETIQKQFGKGEKEAMALANRICKRANEQEFMENMVQDITQNLADL